MWEGGNITDPLSIGLIITVIISHTRLLLTNSISIAEVLCMAVTVIITLAGVVSQVTDRSRVHTVQSTVMASWTAAICIGRTIILSTVEAVVILSIANLVKPITFCVCQANCNLTYSTSITEVFWMAVTVIITLAGVVSKITDWGRVLTVEATVMTSFTTTIFTAAAIATITEETVVVICYVTNLIISRALWMVIAHPLFTKSSIVTEVSTVTIIVISALAGVIYHITHWCWVNTIAIQ